MGLRGTSWLIATLVIFGLALVAILCVIFISTQPVAP
jgi:hypothetical protein